jgi:hypothetical protein
MREHGVSGRREEADSGQNKILTRVHWKLETVSRGIDSRRSRKTGTVELQSYR